MTKVKNPLFSIKASGSLAKTISFVKRLGQPIVEKKPEIPDAKSLAQLSWRHMYLKAVALWHALSAADQQEWESLARRRHMTGYAWFMSQCLKPNPGIYLPLQGGIMQGDIDMAKYRLLELPAPSDDQEAANKEYVDDAEARSTYAEGCLVYRTAHQSIAHNTEVQVTFDAQEYDTDNIHSLVSNPNRLTCNTAGKYIIIGHIEWAQNATGKRQVYLKRAAPVYLCLVREGWGNATHRTTFVIARLLDLAVGEYVRLSVRQTSGGALNIHLGPYSTFFGMQRVG